jgi:hypothetical protein
MSTLGGGVVSRQVQPGRTPSPDAVAPSHTTLQAQRREPPPRPQTPVIHKPSEVRTLLSPAFSGAVLASLGYRPRDRGSNVFGVEGLSVDFGFLRCCKSSNLRSAEAFMPNNSYFITDEAVNEYFADRQGRRGVVVPPTPTSDTGVPTLRLVASITSPSDTAPSASPFAAARCSFLFRHRYPRVRVRRTVGSRSYP